MIILFKDGTFADYPGVKKCCVVDDQLQCSNSDASLVATFPAEKVLAYGPVDEMEKVIRAVNRQQEEVSTAVAP